MEAKGWPQPVVDKARQARDEMERHIDAHGDEQRKLAGAAVNGHAQVDDAGLGAYVKHHGIEDSQAAQRIDEAFAQSNLLPEFDRHYDAVASRPGVLQRERDSAPVVGAQVLRNPADDEGLNKAFAGGDTISSILSQYLGNRIPSFDLRGEAPVPGRKSFRLQNSFATGTLLRARARGCPFCPVRFRFYVVP